MLPACVLADILRTSRFRLQDFEAAWRETTAPDSPELTALNRPVNLEEVYKSQILPGLAMARLRLFPATPMCHIIRTTLDWSEMTTSALLANSGRYLDSFGRLALNTCDLQTIQENIIFGIQNTLNDLHELPLAQQLNSTTATPEDATFDTASTASGDNESYERTLIWCYQAHFIYAALERANTSPHEFRKEDMAMVQQPLLHTVSLWGDINNPERAGAQEDGHQDTNLQDILESFVSDFQEKLKDVMGEYQLPFPVTDEQRKEAHEELSKLGHQI